MNKSGQRPDRKAGRAYGGNAGLAFAMCGALQKRKEPAGRAEAFFCLDFLLLFDQAKSNRPSRGYERERRMSFYEITFEGNNLFYFFLNKLKKANTLKIIVTTKNMLTHMRFLF